MDHNLHLFSVRELDEIADRIDALNKNRRPQRRFSQMKLLG